MKEKRKSKGRGVLHRIGSFAFVVIWTFVFLHLVNQQHSEAKAAMELLGTVLLSMPILHIAPLYEHVASKFL